MGEAGGPVHLMGEKIDSRGVEVISPQRRWSEDSSLSLTEICCLALLAALLGWVPSDRPQALTVCVQGLW